MNSHILFPEDITSFLAWVKTTTELQWSKDPADSYFYNAKWLPLSEQEIDELERKYAIKFGHEHRSFLKIMHTIDKKNPVYTEWDDTEGGENPAETMGHPSYFYNWHEDTKWIEYRLTWPYETILQDIRGLNKTWLKSWGPRPDNVEEKIRAFSEWYSKAPKLLPITAHTFLMDHNFSGLKPVVSVWGTDTVIIAWNLRHYLMRKFSRELGLETLVYDEEDKCYYGEMVRGIPELDALETIRTIDADIPYWKDVITSITPIWPGFRVDD